MNTAAVIDIIELASNKIKKTGIKSFFIVETFTSVKLKNKINMIPNTNTKKEVITIELVYKRFLSFSGKNRMIDWSRPKREIKIINAITDINAVTIPISEVEYSLAAITQKMNPSKAPKSEVSKIYKEFRYNGSFENF
jgi:hypothetical protein